MKSDRVPVYCDILDGCINIVRIYMPQKKYQTCDNIITQIHNIPRLIKEDCVFSEVFYVLAECDKFRSWEPELAASLEGKWKFLADDLKKDPLAAETYRIMLANRQTGWRWLRFWQ